MGPTEVEKGRCHDLGGVPLGVAGNLGRMHPSVWEGGVGDWGDRRRMKLAQVAWKETDSIKANRASGLTIFSFIAGLLTITPTIPSDSGVGMSHYRLYLA